MTFIQILAYVSFKFIFPKSNAFKLNVCLMHAPVILCYSCYLASELQDAVEIMGWLYTNVWSLRHFQILGIQHFSKMHLEPRQALGSRHRTLYQSPTRHLGTHIQPSPRTGGVHEKSAGRRWEPGLRPSY